MERPPVSPSDVTMMRSVQHMISLLILHEVHAATAGYPCLTADQVKARENRFVPYPKKLDHQHKVSERQQHLVTCEQAASEMRALNGRALSPWKYYINHDDSRYPPDISFAECLCEGCIINGTEDHGYNSVLLNASQLVLIKTKCKDGTNMYQLKKKLIEVPVGCTCARPITDVRN